MYWLTEYPLCISRRQSPNTFMLKIHATSLSQPLFEEMASQAAAAARSGSG